MLRPHDAEARIPLHRQEKGHQDSCVWEGAPGLAGQLGGMAPSGMGLQPHLQA